MSADMPPWGRQDSDFHATEFQFSLVIDGHEGVYGEIEDYDPGDWDLSDDPAENADQTKHLLAEIRDALTPRIAHFHSIGLIRVDVLKPCSTGDQACDDQHAGVRFILVHESGQANLAPEVLVDFPDTVIALASLPGARLTIRINAVPTNVSRFFELAQQGGLGVGQWRGDATAHLLPSKSESRDAWCARIAFSERQVSRLTDRWTASGRTMKTFQVYGGVSERRDGDQEISWLVDGIIPRGELTLLIGNSAAGKSSTIHGWLAALCGDTIKRKRYVLGREITGHFRGALIAGEDSAGVINYRAAKHALIWGEAPRYAVFCDGSIPLAQYLELLSRMPQIDVVFIDPVRVFFAGNELASGDIEAFCKPLVKFAREKNCAIVLVHHLTKAGEAVTALAALADHIRGSGAFRQAVRMTIGLARRRDGTIEVGPLKYNLPPETVWLPMGHSERFWPNPDTFTLDPIGPENSTAKPIEASTEAVAKQVMAAVARCNRTGTIVRKSGKCGLFECRLPELAGCTRSIILSAIASLVTAGELIDGEGGLAASYSPSSE